MYDIPLVSVCGVRLCVPVFFDFYTGKKIKYFRNRFIHSLKIFTSRNSLFLFSAVAVVVFPDSRVSLCLFIVTEFSLQTPCSRSGKNLRCRKSTYFLLSKRDKSEPNIENRFSFIPPKKWDEEEKVEKRSLHSGCLANKNYAPKWQWPFSLHSRRHHKFPTAVVFSLLSQLPQPLSSFILLFWPICSWDDGEHTHTHSNNNSTFQQRKLNNTAAGRIPTAWFDFWFEQFSLRKCSDWTFPLKRKDHSAEERKEVLSGVV